MTTQKDEVEKLAEEVEHNFTGDISYECYWEKVARFILRRQLESRIDQMKNIPVGISAQEIGFRIAALTQQLKELQ